MFQGVTIKAFHSYFRNEEDCKQYLFHLKWQEGYQCRKCSCNVSGKGKTRFHLRCQQCGYDESVTAHTLFHKLKLPLLAAFGIMFRITVRKKGMSTVELSNEYNINQKSAWLFKRKAQEAMKSSGDHLLSGKVEVDELLIGGPEKNKRGRSKGNKKLVVLAVEKVKDDKIGRAYAATIEHASAECFRPFFELHIDSDTTQVKTDKWKGYQPLQSEFDITQKHSGKGKNFTGLHTVIMNLKSWLRGIHHKCSERFMNGYLDEFFFRFNRRNHLNTILHKFVVRMVEHVPYTYKANAT
jgi:hypothetical protein